MVARQIVALGDFIVGNLEFFLQFSQPETPNSFLPPLDGTAMGAAAENRPVIGSWQLAPGEALLLEVPPPDGLYWSYSLGNPWWETIDYAAHQSSLNGFQADVDDDGIVRAVVAHEDPGVANWLDTAGHSAGPMILRCVRTATAPVPTTRVLPLADVVRRAAAGDPPGRTGGTPGRPGGAAPGREQAVHPMTLRPDELEDEARRQTGLDDFGDGGHREGLERLIASMNEEADLTEVGEIVQQARLVMLLSSRLRVEETYREHPEIARQEVEGPVFVIGLPRTGHHGAEPAGGRRSPVPLAAAVGVELALPATGGGDAAQRPPHRRDRGRPGHDARDVPAHGEHAPRGSDDADRVPGPDGHDVPHRPLRRHGPGSELHGRGSPSATCASPTSTTGACSASCSGTARPGCGTSRRRCTCSPSTR